jgi:alpha-beta hydrolase superfamily lysophospholipase
MAVLSLPPIFYIVAGPRRRHVRDFPPCEPNSMPPCPARRWPLPVCLIALIARPAVVQGAPPPAPAAAAAKPAAKDTVAEVNLEASDGTPIAAWHYGLPADATAAGIVILLHDLGGSHRTVEPLARSLQAAGCVVVAPDLRGHGESKLAALPSSQDDQSKLLRKADFEMMAASGGGRVRDQSAIRGDVECVRNWIVQETREKRLPQAPLFVVGSGLGAAVAVQWAAADAAWPDLASGPQGREVAGLVMISPAFATKGFSLTPALGSEAVRRTIPVLVLAGAGDRDAIKVFEQMKRQRPKEWYDGRRPPGSEKDASPATAAKASLLFLTHPSDRSGDALAASKSSDKGGRAADPAAVIPGFMKVVADRSG